MAVVRCNNCKEYYDKDEMFLVGISSFCSRDCMYEKQNAKKPAKKNKNRTNSRQEDEAKPSTDFSPETREHIFKRDGYRCGLCGESSGDLVIHHIHYRTEVALGVEFLTSAENGITLCNRPCHLDIVHQNKKKWQPFLRELAKQRENEL